jgi:hypothetical protein
MSERNNNKESFNSCCTGSVHNIEISDLIRLLPIFRQETSDTVRSLQKAIAGLRQQVQDSRAEHAEDNAEIKQLLHELRRNKVWIPRERV